ncbi:AT-hook motif nuclear-localized protein 10, partial [Mucuna pruriens]
MAGENISIQCANAKFEKERKKKVDVRSRKRKDDDCIEAYSELLGTNDRIAVVVVVESSQRFQDQNLSMSGSDMAGREQFAVGMHKPQPQSQQQPQLHQNMRLDYAADATVVFAAPTVNINGGDSSAAALPPGLGLPQDQAQPLPRPIFGSPSESAKRKRGRPRKYGPDGGMALALTTSSPPGAAAAPVSHSGEAFPPALPSDSASAGSGKRRGRPRGSLNKNSSKFSGLGTLFTPHVITVKAGEDLSSTIMTLCQSSSRNICILTANGAISNVTLRQPATSGGTVTYEGRFEILSLGGTLILAENDAHGGRIGGLSVSLSGPDGRVLGGGVAGLLIAASPVQLVLASFVSDVRKQSKSAKRMENASSAAAKASTAAGQSSSPSRGTLSESSGGAGSGSPLNQSTEACNNNNNNTPPQGFSGMPWNYD